MDDLTHFLINAMSCYKYSLFVQAITLILIFCSVSGSYGSETRVDKIIQLDGNDIIGNDLIVACKTLKMYGEVREDLLAGGLHLSIGNMVSQDLTAGGYSINLDGSVGDDVRLAGANVHIDGTVMGDLVVFGANLVISGDVMGDVIAGGGNIEITGNINGTLDARCGQIRVDGNIDRSAVIAAHRLNISSKSSLGGNLTYTSSYEAKIEDGAQIAGEVERRSDGIGMIVWGLASTLADHLPEHPDSWKNWKNQLPIWFRTLLRLSSFVSLFLAGIIMLMLYRRHAITVADRIISFPLKSLLLGLVFLVCVPIGAIILCITIVGLPIGLVSLATYFVFSYISRIYVGLVIGREILDRISKQEIRIIWHMILGLFIITALTSIPYYIGSVIRIIFIILGLGGMMMTGRRLRVMQREEIT
jgi:cytoskeletal protein CcmA (bactofilin family)